MSEVIRCNNCGWIGTEEIDLEMIPLVPDEYDDTNVIDVEIIDASPKVKQTNI
jgi:hypothetical protein